MKKKQSPKAVEVSAPSLVQILGVGIDRNVWRSAVARIRHIHEQVRTRQYPNCCKLKKKFSVSKRSIERDMQAIRDSLNMPLEFDFQRNGYYYTREVPADLPRPRLSAGDVVAFCLAKRALERLRGTDFAALFEEALRKIMEEVEGEVPLEWAELDRLVSFGATGAPKVPDTKIAAAVSEALLRQQELSVDYRNAVGRKHEPRLLQPLHLRAMEDSVLLFAIDPKKEDGVVRRFVLSRMRNAKVTERGFERPAAFDADEEMKHSVGAYRGGKPERVRVGLSEFAARFLDERPLHHSQQIVLKKRTAAKRGKTKAKASGAGEQVAAMDPSSPEYCQFAELTMQVAITPELEQKILQWGVELEVQEPRSFQERITRVGEVLAARGRRRETCKPEASGIAETGKRRPETGKERNS